MAQQTQLSAAIATTVVTSITVDDYLGFPASGAFTVLVDSELLRVTAGNGTTTWTVTRGYSSTTAATHADNSVVYLVNTDGYADVPDLLATMDVPSGTGSADRRLVIADLLADARAQTDTDCARTFFRVPLVSGDVTVYCDVQHAGYSSLVSAIGHPYTVDGRALDIVSVTSLYYRDSETSSYTAIAAGDTGYYLEGGYGPGIAGTDWPYEDVSLSAASATITRWPTGKRAVKIVGALGFPAIPDVVKRANIDKAREAYRAGPGGGASPGGVNRFGTPVFAGDTPSSYRALVAPGSVYVKRSWRVV
jgi:hypothetical protein